MTERDGRLLVGLTRRHLPLPYTPILATLQPVPRNPEQVGASGFLFLVVQSIKISCSGGLEPDRDIHIRKRAGARHSYTQKPHHHQLIDDHILSRASEVVMKIIVLTSAYTELAEQRTVDSVQHDR